MGQNPAPSGAPQAFVWPTGVLFALAVVVWGTTWHAIVYQLAETPPEMAVALRFALAGAAGLAVAGWMSLRRGDRWWLSPSEQLRVALQGIFMYSLSYLCVYYAEQHVFSGLVAIGYSLSPLINGVAARLIWGAPLTGRFVSGGLLGMAGVVLIFWPELQAALQTLPASEALSVPGELPASGTLPASGAPSASGAMPEATPAGGHTTTGNTLAGLLFMLAAVGLSSVGSLSASRNASRRMPFWPALGWGMLWGAACSAAVAAHSGARFEWPSSPAWWVSLLYLSLAGSLVAFACFLTLQQRLGAGPASTVGVATPALALAVSWAVEGYRPGLLSLAGVVLALLGNAWALGLLPGLQRPAAAGLSGSSTSTSSAED